MKNKKELSKQEKIALLSPKSQAKLEEIRQQQHFATLEEAYDYLIGFAKKN